MTDYDSDGHDTDTDTNASNNVSRNIWNLDNGKQFTVEAFGILSSGV